MEERRNCLKARRLSVRPVVRLALAVTLMAAIQVGGAARAAFGIGVPAGPLPDVPCGVDWCKPQSITNKPPTSTAPKPHHTSPHSGPTMCTANGHTGPISSEPVDPQPTGAPPGYVLKHIKCGGVLLHDEWVYEGGPATNSAAQSAHAQKLITFPVPHIHTNPDAGSEQIVGMTTWLWVDSTDTGTKSDTAVAGPVQTTATLSATKVTWHIDDPNDPNATFTCQGSGQAWAPGATPGPGACLYTFKDSSAGRGQNDNFTLTATITWTGTWSDTNGGGGSLGPIDMTSSIPVRVAEGQAINDK